MYVPSRTRRSYPPAAAAVVVASTVEPLSTRTVAPASARPSLASVTVPAIRPVGGGRNLIDWVSDTTAVLKEYCSAIVPAAFSMPTVAELPCSRGSAPMLRYRVTMLPSSFSWTSTSTCRLVLKKLTLRHSMRNDRFGAVPVVLVHIDPVPEITFRSSHNG